MITLHNTRTGSDEVFQPSQADRVTVYTCGPTVYSEPLVGNWVAYIRWDVLVRTLAAEGYRVDRVMNITDVGHLTSDADDGEDKMEKGARREGTTAWDVADRYTNRFLEGMTALNLLPPETLAKATEHIDEQIALIKRLEQNGHTYRIDDGIYFDTATFLSYADFAHLEPASLKAGARVTFNVQKRNPSDFALWKFSSVGRSRDMEWDSPWGKGFPGWHIECSAMALRYLGDTLDIHTGGIDHIPIHHTNEIAQSEAATGKRFASVWLHANFLLSDGRKVSKSLGNGYSLTDVVEHGYTALDFKLFVLQSHYRSESNFTWENLQAAANRLARWKNAAVLRHQVPEDAHGAAELTERIHAAKPAIHDALRQDLNTPRALMHADALFDQLEQADLAALNRSVLTELFMWLDDVFGLRLLDTTPDLSDQYKQLLAERADARQRQDWHRSDALRESLADANIGLLDTTDGVRWYYR